MKEFEKKLPEICEFFEENFLACYEQAKQNGGMLHEDEAEHMRNLAHTMKSLCAVKHEKAHEAEESGENGRGYGYRDGYSQARSATTGRYMDGGNGYGTGYGEYRDGYGRGMYRDDGKEQVRMALQEAMRKAPDRQSRQAFEEAMRQF